MTIEQFDKIIIGSGQAAPSLAVRLANSGEKVALVEADRLGGTCVNTGCTPTKTLRKSARVAHMVRRADDFGIAVDAFTVDFPKAMERMQQRVETARSGLESWVADNGVHVVHAHGKLAGKQGDNFVVEAADRQLQAPRIFLNTGTRPFFPPIAGLADVPHLDNRGLLELRELPRHLIVIGGSYIGLEMAQIFRRLGSEVTVLETSTHVASREDRDISTQIREFLEEGVRILTEVRIEEMAAAADGGCSVALADGKVEGSHLLVATGRVPNTDQLGLETVDIETGPRGHIQTNGRLETSTPGIWALGDINGRGAFTHTAFHDYEIVASNLEGGSRSADDRIMAYAMFTDPPLGHVGIHESEARRLVSEGRKVSMAVFDMKDVSRAKEESELAGRIRIIVDDDSGHVLGATMLGINADEIIQIFVQFMAAEGEWKKMRDALPVHPTVAEFIPTILDKLEPLGKA